MSLDELPTHVRDIVSDFTQTVDLAMLRKTCTRLRGAIGLGRSFKASHSSKNLDTDLETTLSSPSAFLESLDLVYAGEWQPLLSESQFQRLRRLHLSLNSAYVQSFLSDLPGLRRLTDLELLHMDAISTGDELKNLAPKMPNLLHLVLRSSRLHTTKVDLSDFRRLRHVEVFCRRHPGTELCLELPSSVTEITTDLTVTVCGNAKVHTLDLRLARPFDLDTRVWPDLKSLTCDPLQELLNANGLQLQTLTLSDEIRASRPGFQGRLVLEQLDLTKLQTLKPLRRRGLSFVPNLEAIHTLELEFETTASLEPLLCLKATLVHLTITATESRGEICLGSIRQFVQLQTLILKVGRTLQHVEVRMDAFNGCQKLRHLTLLNLVLTHLENFVSPRLQSIDVRLTTAQSAMSSLLCAKLPTTVQFFVLGFYAWDRDHFLATLAPLRCLQRLKWFDFEYLYGTPGFFKYEDIAAVIPPTCGTNPRLFAPQKFHQ